MNTLIEELSRDPFVETDQTLNVIDTTMKYLVRKSKYDGTMLDIGRESPLTKRVRAIYDVTNTSGDLDTITFSSDIKYDYILYSHTIEHQFNPLHTLLELRKVMSEESVMYIILPNKPKFLWWEGHFHEIDNYRMTLLLKRAGYEIISYERHRAWRNWKFYLKGIRPLLRVFLEFNAYYEVKIK